MSARAGTACFFVTLLALASWSCRRSGAVISSIDDRAGLAGSLRWNPLQWNVITFSIARNDSTTSTLYGNDVAVRYARMSSQQDYPAGSVLSLVTWVQREDGHWFGAKIPGPVKSVEFVTVTARPNNHPTYSYENYEGSPLMRTSASDGRSPGSRAAYLFSLRASVMP